MNNYLMWLDQRAGLVFAILAVLVLIEIVLRLGRRDNGTGTGNRAARKNSQTELDEVLNTSTEVFMLVRKADRMPVFVTENAGEMLGIDSFTIQNDLNILIELVDKKTIRMIKRAFENWKEGTLFSVEFFFHRFSEEQQNYGKLTIRATEDGKYDLVTFYDITQEREIRDELENKVREVQAVDESKTVFLSKMSHEIRTPMNGMLGMIHLARISMENQEEAEAKEYLDKAEGLSQFLLSIINDILDMSRIESGKLELEKAKFSLYDMADKIQTMFQASIEDKGIQFELKLQDFKVRYVLGDELRITQVLSNFLSNASKFTPEGGAISVTIRQMDLIGEKVTVMFRVSDTGKGMAPEFLHRIFQPFEQEDSGIARKFGGSGLGMAISDNLVRLMDGKILIDSEEGKGSTFTVFLELPVAEGSQEPQMQEQAEQREISLEGRRLLMAEDNQINALVATRLLSKDGLVIEVASNGRIALEMFCNHEPGYYDAILMDIHMPEMDGWEATKQIRSLAREDAGRIPIFALSADAFVEDKRHSLLVGMNGHIAKPIDYDELKQALMEFIDAEGRNER